MKSYPTHISRKKFVNYIFLGIILSVSFFQLHKMFELKKHIIISKEGWILSAEEYDI
jgi:hypothetical protein